MISEVKNIDCLSGMKQFPDKFFQLAISDPPYGIGASNYIRGGTQHGNSKAKCKTYTKKDWDNQTPTKEYFNELFRVSQNQIIFGANHFIESIPFNSSCWLVWDKDNGEGSAYADCELAWTSFKTAVRRFKWRWAGMLQQNMGERKQIRIHPTEKPIQLYRWILQKYGKLGDKILDSHLGSGSSRRAAHIENFDFWGFEIDEEYFLNQEKAFNILKSQTTLF